MDQDPLRSLSVHDMHLYGAVHPIEINHQGEGMCGPTDSPSRSPKSYLVVLVLVGSTFQKKVLVGSMELQNRSSGADASSEPAPSTRVHKIGWR
jgi:hypothetical protein